MLIKSNLKHHFLRFGWFAPHKFSVTPPPPPPGAPHKKIMHIIFFYLLIYKYKILTNLPKVSCGFNSIYSIQIGKFTCKNFDVSGPDKVLLTCISIYVSLYTPLPPPPPIPTGQPGVQGLRGDPGFDGNPGIDGLEGRPVWPSCFISLRNKPWKYQMMFYIHTLLCWLCI